VSPYEPATRWNEDPLRPRKLLLHRHEIRRLRGKVEAKGFALIPLDLYLKRGVVKVTLALARGRKLHDKREKLRRETQEREARRAIDAHR
jgi:SsrA-binding protein